MQLVATLTLLAVFPLGCTSWRAAKLYQSGTAELDAGRVARALEDLSEAARLKPDASEIQNHLGLARLAAGDRAAAREAFERAVAIDCDNPAARRNLAAVEVDQREGL
jgi:Flp pilus assembly protein TadD